MVMRNPAGKSVSNQTHGHTPDFKGHIALSTNTLGSATSPATFRDLSPLDDLTDSETEPDANSTATQDAVTVASSIAPSSNQSHLDSPKPMTVASAAPQATPQSIMRQSTDGKSRKRHRDQDDNPTEVSLRSAKKSKSSSSSILSTKMTKRIAHQEIMSGQASKSSALPAKQLTEVVSSGSSTATQKTRRELTNEKSTKRVAPPPEVMTAKRRRSALSQSIPAITPITLTTAASSVPSQPSTQFSTTILAFDPPKSIYGNLRFKKTRKSSATAAETSAGPEQLPEVPAVEDLHPSTNSISSPYVTVPNEREGVVVDEYPSQEFNRAPSTADQEGSSEFLNNHFLSARTRQTTPSVAIASAKNSWSRSNAAAQIVPSGKVRRNANIEIPETTTSSQHPLQSSTDKNKDVYAKLKFKKKPKTLPVETVPSATPNESSRRSDEKQPAAVDTLDESMNVGGTASSPAALADPTVTAEIAVASSIHIDTTFLRPPVTAKREEEPVYLNLAEESSSTTTTTQSQNIEADSFPSKPTDYIDNVILTEDEPVQDESMLLMDALLPDPNDTMTLATSEDIMALTVSATDVSARPPLSRNPPIWAVSRQEVCESFPYFRSYQGGVYFSGGFVRGYLLSGFPSRRDVFEHGGKLIISHGGGKAESIHSARGQSVTQAATDQLAADNSVRALLANYKQHTSCVLLIDDKYSLFPYNLAATGVTYAVLGRYNITHAWAERQPSNNSTGHVVRYKFAFQWCENQEPPWWVPNTPLAGIVDHNLAPESDTPLPKLPSIFQKCDECHKKSPQVYAQSWTCLIPTCPEFWKMNSADNELTYHPAFLQLQSMRQQSDRHISLTENLAMSKHGVKGKSRNSFATYEASRGWHCSKCGRLSCRHKWQKWECSSCQATLDVPCEVRLPRELRVNATVGPLDLSAWVSASAGIRKGVEYIIHRRTSDVICQTFTLPEGRGLIHQLRHRPRAANTEPDHIFKQYQEQANNGTLPFKRWPLRNHKLRGSLLTNYFSQNCGVPYQYVGGTANTVPFDEAPSCVLDARDFMAAQAKACLPSLSNFFPNEVLSAAYMEKQSMAFHSDAERGLGPVVAGLSLGSPALMHFRLLAKYAPAGGRKNANVMSFVLRHGDILIMDGLRVQEFYQHTVVPKGFRMSATARHISLAEAA